MIHEKDIKKLIITAYVKKLVYFWEIGALFQLL